MTKSKTKVYNLSRIIPEMSKVFSEAELDYLARLLHNPLECAPLNDKAKAKKRLSHICEKALIMKQGSIDAN